MKLSRLAPSRFFRSLGVLALAMLGAAAAPAQSVTLVPNATKVAGTGTAGWNGDFGQAGVLQLNGPSSLFIDRLGYTYITDKNNNCIRRVDTSGASIVLAGLVSAGANDTCNTSSNTAPSTAQGLLTPAGVTVDVGQNVYIADAGHNCVRELVAGSTPGTQNLVQAVGTCGATNLNTVTPLPAGLVTDKSGNLYISIRDTTDGIYQILRHNAGAAANSVCLVAGTPSAAVSTPCTGITNNITLNQPSGLTFDPAGILYIADTANNCIRSLSTSGTFATIIGTCGSASSNITNPRGLIVSQAGNLFFVTSSPSRYYRYMIGSGALLQVGGNPDGSAGTYSSTQSGAAATSVPLNAPAGIAIDATNNTYVADTGNNVVRRFSFGNIFPNTATSSSSVAQLLTFQINQNSTLSTAFGPDYTADPALNTCNGPQTAASAGSPPRFCSISVTFTPTRPGRRYSPVVVTDTSTTPSTGVTAGLQGIGVGAQGLLFQGQAGTRVTGINNGIDLGSDSAGNMYVLEKGTTAGTSDIKFVPVNGGAPTIAIDTGLANPTALAGDAGGNWYVADSGTNTVQRFSAFGVATPNYITGLDTPSTLFVDGFGNSVIGENGTRKDVLEVYAGGVRRIIAGGGTGAPMEGVPATSIAFQSVTAVAMALDGTVYIGDAAAHRIYGVDTVGIIHMFAGNGTSTNTTNGTALGQGFGAITDLDVDPAGDVVVTDAGNNKVVMIYASTTGTTNLVRVFGNQDNSAGYSGDGGPSSQAALNNPMAIELAPDGTGYIVDRNNSALRTVRYLSYPSYPLLDFGNHVVGSTTTLTQSIFNEGNANLIRTTDPVISNAQFTNDAAATTCGLAVVPGLSCDFGFDYKPTVVGTQTGTATINDSDPNSPQVIGLRAVSTAATITGFTAPAETETYGGPYNGSVTIATNGGTVPSGTVTFSINGGTVTCTATVTGAGTTTCTLPNGTLLPVTGSPYPVTITFNGNYPTQTTTTTLAELPKPLTETVDDKTKQYLQPNPTFTGNPNGVISTGVGSQSFTVTYSSPATQTSVAGRYPITATITPAAGTDPANYAITNNPGTLTITAAALGTFTGAGSPETEVYGGVYNGTVTYSTTGGVAPTGTLTFSVNGTTVCTTPITGATSTTCTNPAGTGLAVGTYTVNIAYSGDTNYAAATTTAQLTVTKAPLTVTVNSQTKSYGAANPTLTGTVSGLVNGDTLGGTIVVTYSTTVTATSPVGVYPGAITATVTGSSAGNYNVTVVPGNFAVTGISTTMRLTTSGSPVQTGTNVTFTAVVSPAAGSTGVPNGPVVFLSDGVVLGTGTLDGTGTATLSTAALTVGSHTIVANYAGNGNFGSSTATLTQVITAPVGSFLVQAAPATQLIHGAGTTTYQVTVTSVNGFAGPVALTCAGLPADASCAFAQSTVTLTANGSVTTTMTTTTTAADATAALHRFNLAPAFGPRTTGAPQTGDGLLAAATMFPMQLGGLGFFAAGARRRKRLGSRWYLLALLALSVAVIGMSGCGCPPSAYHAYPITITGTSVNGGPAPSSAVVYLYVASATS